MNPIRVSVFIVVTSASFVGCATVAEKDLARCGDIEWQAPRSLAGRQVTINIEPLEWDDTENENALEVVHKQYPVSDSHVGILETSLLAALARLPFVDDAISQDEGFESDLTLSVKISNLAVGFVRRDSINPWNFALNLLNGWTAWVVHDEVYVLSFQAEVNLTRSDIQHSPTVQLKQVALSQRTLNFHERTRGITPYLLGQFVPATWLPSDADAIVEALAPGAWYELLSVLFDADLKTLLTPKQTPVSTQESTLAAQPAHPSLPNPLPTDAVHQPSSVSNPSLRPSIASPSSPKPRSRLSLMNQSYLPALPIADDRLKIILGEKLQPGVVAHLKDIPSAGYSQQDTVVLNVACENGLHIAEIRSGDTVLLAASKSNGAKPLSEFIVRKKISELAEPCYYEITDSQGRVSTAALAIYQP